MSKNNEMKKKKTNKQTKIENENCQESIQTQAESNSFFRGNASLIFLTFGLHFEKGCNKGEEENK